MSYSAGIPDDAICVECGRTGTDLERIEDSYRCHGSWECSSIVRRRSIQRACGVEDE